MRRNGNAPRKAIALGLAFFLPIAAFAGTGIEVSWGALIGDDPVEPLATASFDADARYRVGASGYTAFGAEGSLNVVGDEPSVGGQGTAYARFGGLVGLHSISARLGLSGSVGDTLTDDLAAISLSVPLTLNGESASLYLEPGVTWDPTSEGYALVGLTAFSTLAVGNAVLKPGVRFSYAEYDDGTLSVVMTPSAGFSWYPLVPASAGGSLSLTREYLRETRTIRYSGEARVWLAISVSPLLLVSAEGSLGYDGSDLSGEGLIKLAFYAPRPEGNRLSFPVEIRYAVEDSPVLLLRGGIRLDL